MNTSLTNGSSTRLAQSVASRLRQSVLHFVGHPNLRMTAFHLPDGVFTNVAKVGFLRLSTVQGLGS